MKYFNDCKTVEDLKQVYKKLARENHPDLGGNLEVMQQINAEYDVIFEKLKNTHKNADGEAYESKEKTTEMPETFRNIIVNLMKFDEINIDVVGSWIWVSGNTYSCKDALKQQGFKWAKNKQMWYWHPADQQSHNRKKLTYEEIKNLHGCETIKSAKETKKIA